MNNNYEVLPNGVIKQKRIEKIIYDYDYSNKYNKYGEKGKHLSYLRFGVLIGILNKMPKSIVDVGYGNGDFLNVCRGNIENVFGCDISNYPIPAGCRKIEFNTIDVEVTCFFDSLEHFDDITVIKDLKTEYIYFCSMVSLYISRVV
jgi:ubiquinone/menaquinone biosynthesis C-methylase UbiE